MACDEIEINESWGARTRIIGSFFRSTSTSLGVLEPPYRELFIKRL